MSDTAAPNPEPRPITAYAAPALAGALAAAAAAWAVAFAVHLPGVHLPTPLSTAMIAIAHTIGVATATRRVPSPRRWIAGALAGLLAGVIDCMVLGALLAEGELNPVVTIAGFLLATTILGLVAAALSTLSPARTSAEVQDWISASAWATALATLCLLFVGGTVTSANAGMAVPDWPGTYGENMLLYPLAQMAADSEIYLEHAHRLFGMLVGLCTLITAIIVTCLDNRRWTKAMTWSLVVLVIVQGILGGVRVIKESEATGVAHGVLGQTFLALLVAQAIWLSKPWRLARDNPDAVYSKKLHKAATGFVHAYFLQLLTGSIYRHLSHGEVPAAITHSALGLHILGSLAAVVFAMIAAAAAMGSATDADPRKSRFSISGKALYAAVIAQFILGWVTLFIVLSAPERKAPTAEDLADTKPVPIHETAIPTAHQALGATLFTLGAFILTWSRASRKPHRDPENTPQEA